VKFLIIFRNSFFCWSHPFSMQNSTRERKIELKIKLPTRCWRSVCSSSASGKETEMYLKLGGLLGEHKDLSLAHCVCSNMLLRKGLSLHLTKNVHNALDIILIKQPAHNIYNTIKIKDASLFSWKDKAQLLSYALPTRNIYKCLLALDTLWCAPRVLQLVLLVLDWHVMKFSIVDSLSDTWEIFIRLAGFCGYICIKMASSLLMYAWVWIFWGEKFLDEDSSSASQVLSRCHVV
jgi:hypothetical protein